MCGGIDRDLASAPLGSPPSQRDPARFRAAPRRPDLPPYPPGVRRVPPGGMAPEPATLDGSGPALAEVLARRGAPPSPSLSRRGGAGAPRWWAPRWWVPRWWPCRGGGRAHAGPPSPGSLPDAIRPLVAEVLRLSPSPRRAAAEVLGRRGALTPRRSAEVLGRDAPGSAARLAPVLSPPRCSGDACGPPTS